MAHFHGICHKRFDLSYVGGFLELRKLTFSGLKCQFDVLKTNFRGLIGDWKPTLALEPKCGIFS